MLSRMHNRLGTAGLVIAIIALVAAMTGGAYAALSPNDKRVVKKEAKKFSNKFSKKYAKQFAIPGPAGAPGAKGDTGAKGDKGDAGTNGTNGTNGTSVTSSPATAGECPTGGTKFTSASGTSKVCNGTNGTTGFTETLPAGKTLRGVFASFPSQPLFDISFNIPLTATPTVNVIKEDGTVASNSSGDPVGVATNCPGTAAEPKANPGNLCLYANPGMENELNNVNPFYETEEGFVLSSGFGGGGNGALIGSWAVTAPTS